MEKRFFVRIAYDGRDFHGWQYQPNVISGQELFEKAVAKIAKKQVTTYASGRTDSGVHALCQYVHFDLETRMNYKTMFLALQTKLPKNIRVLEIQEVDKELHSRYQAYRRSYLYFITKESSPFNHRYKTFLPHQKVYPEQIRECFKRFIGKKDFLAFSRPNPTVKSTVCDLQELEIVEREHDYYIRVTANRFLHNMVRRIVGTALLFTNKGYDYDMISEIIEKKEQNQTYILTAPPTGLFLTRVYYPREIDPTTMVKYEEDFVKQF